MTQDPVDQILTQWARERPDLDASPIAVIGRVRRLSRLIERDIQKVLHKVSPGSQLQIWGFDVLAALRRSGPPYSLSPTELFNSLLVSSGAMTNRIDQLEKAGLVERIRDSEDRRGVSIALTGAGQRLIDEVIAAHVDNGRHLLGALGDDEKKALADLLRQLLLSLENEDPRRVGHDRPTTPRSSPR